MSITKAPVPASSHFLVTSDEAYDQYLATSSTLLIYRDVHHFLHNVFPRRTARGCDQPKEKRADGPAGQGIRMIPEPEESP